MTKLNTTTFQPIWIFFTNETNKQNISVKKHFKNKIKALY